MNIALSRSRSSSASSSQRTIVMPAVSSAGRTWRAVDLGLHRQQLVGDQRDLLEHLARLEPGGRAHGDAGGDAALQAGHPHHEELVEVRGEDRQVAGPLEQRHVLVGGELEHPLVELQPGDLAVEEAVGLQHDVLSATGAVPGGPTTKRPFAARGWWVRVSVAAALAMETSLTMLAPAAASAAAWLADLSSSASTLGFAVMTQSCQVAARVYCPSTAASVNPSRS